MDVKRKKMKNHPQNTMPNAQAVASSQLLESGINVQSALFSIFAQNVNLQLFILTTW